MPLAARFVPPLLAGTLSAAFLAGCGSDAATPPAPTSRLVIAEFLYRSGVDSLEWIELRNDGEAPARLAGVTLPAVAYRFPDATAALPSGHRVLLVNDAALFAARHPGIPIFGVFTGRLADEGEDLSLEGTGDGGFTVVWNRSEPWPQGAVHLGRSLVWKGGDPRLATSWAASAVAGGEPGAAENPVADPGVTVAEVLPRTATGETFVELASNASGPVDLGGWWLVHDVYAPDTLVIPAGVSIPAGGRVVFSRGASDPKLELGEFDPRGAEGRVLLVRRDAGGKPTGNASSLSWDAVPAGSSVARLGTWGSGILSSPTPGRSDARLPAPVAYVSEVCYHPASGAEYVEIASLSDTAIPLGNALDSNLSWRLEGADLRFGVVDTLPARGRVVAVSALETTAALFRELKGLPMTIPVVTYAGRLDNAGDRLVLGRPTTAVTTASGRLQWKVQPVDAAAWLPVAPWPASADGGGGCLERIDPTLPGDEPTAWRAAAPSPGK